MEETPPCPEPNPAGPICCSSVVKTAMRIASRSSGIPSEDDQDSYYFERVLTGIWVYVAAVAASFAVATVASPAGVSGAVLLLPFQGNDNRPENLELWTRPQPSGIRVSDAIEWARQILGLYEGIGAPPTALTISRERPWRWRESNRGSRICKSARQRHRFESTCHFGETERYSLVLVGTHWHSLVRAARVLFVSHRGRAFRIRLCSARKSHRGCPIPALGGRVPATT